MYNTLLRNYACQAGKLRLYVNYPKFSHLENCKLLQSDFT